MRSSALLASMPDRFSHRVRHWAQTRPKGIALVDGAKSATYEDLWLATQDAIEILVRSGVRAGDRVIVVNENSIATVILLLAISEMDACSIPVNARLSASEVANITAVADARVTVYSDAKSSESVCAHSRAAGAREFEFSDRELGRISVGAINSAVAQSPIFADKEKQLAIVLYTSGTSGVPKGVMLSHQAIMYVGSSLVDLRGLSVDDSFYAAAPFSHIFGFGAVLLGALWAGATARLTDRFDAKQLVADLAQNRISYLMGVPTMFARLLECAESAGVSIKSTRLRGLQSGGARMEPELLQKLSGALGVPVDNSYGLSECSPVTRTVGGCVEGEVGCPPPEVQIKLVSSDGQDVQSQAVGEIWVKGPSLMLGYFRDEPATALGMRPGGWFATGDLGRLNEHGSLLIVGRVKDVIVRSGFNVYADEVERVLNRHPLVALSAVVGRRVPNNEEVLAFIQPIDGPEPSAKELEGWCRSELAPYKVPSEFRFIEELPIGSNGKLLKAQLKKLAEGSNET